MLQLKDGSFNKLLLYKTIECKLADGNKESNIFLTFQKTQSKKTKEQIAVRYHTPYSKLYATQLLLAWTGSKLLRE